MVAQIDSYESKVTFNEVHRPDVHVEEVWLRQKKIIEERERG